MQNLSIIIPHFNSPIKLERLLNSIPKQEWIQVIVIDDHSEENLKPTKPGLVTKYPHVIFGQTPLNQKGPGMARNEGIKRCDSDWIIFADADDYFLENAFDVIKKYLDSDNECIYFAPKSINVDTNLPADRHEPFVEQIKDFLENLDSTVFFKSYAPWCKLIKRSLLLDNNISFDDGIGGEDNVFSLKVPFYASKVAADKTEIYCVTESNESLTKSMSKLVLTNHFNALSRYNDFLQKNKMKEKQAPMLGWIIRGFKESPSLGFNWLIQCLKKSYPLSIWRYIEKYTPISSRKTI